MNSPDIVFYRDNYHLHMTYDFVQRAFKVRHEDAVTIGMIAASYFSTNGITVGRVRERLSALPATAWREELLGLLTAPDDHYMGRFKSIQSPWCAGQLVPRQRWVEALADLANAEEHETALELLSQMESELKGHGGEEKFLLGLFAHLLHPTWFAVVNGQSEQFWLDLGYEVGGVDNLETISSHYRLDGGVGTDFNTIDALVARPYSEIETEDDE